MQDHELGCSSVLCIILLLLLLLLSLSLSNRGECLGAIAAEEGRSNILDWHNFTFHPIEPGTGRQHAEVLALPGVERLAPGHEEPIDSQRRVRTAERAERRCINHTDGQADYKDTRGPVSVRQNSYESDDAFEKLVLIMHARSALGGKSATTR